VQSLSSRQFSNVVSSQGSSLCGDIDAGAIHIGDLRLKVE
jgi:hypothetical protein